MIQLRINGRAGNQLFQYATVYAYIKKNNIEEKIKISFQDLKKRKTDEKTFIDELKNFKNVKYELIENVYMTFKQKKIDFLYRVTIKIIRSYRKIFKKSMQEKDYKLVEKIWHKILNKNGLYYFIPTTTKFYNSKSDNIIFYGAFENEGFFKEYEKEIKKIFLIEKDDNINEGLNMVIKNSNSICVTIRRGDFLIDKFKKNFYICTPEYFTNSIKYMNQIIKNPQYIVFSDDIEWCKKNMNFPVDTIYESGNDTIQEKLRLMKSCKNFIISNSTFSWWAQFLSENDNKIVIAPKKWNNFEYSEQIYNDKWILL